MNINKISLRPLALAKSLMLVPGRRVRMVPIGLFAGMTLHLDLATETQFYLGLWELEIHSMLRQQAQSVSWFVDVGAGKGELCIYFAKHHNMKRVIGFEPSESEAAFFKQNIEANRHLLKCVPEIKTQFLGSGRDSNIAALDQVNRFADGPGFLKIDVDGFEMDVLKGSEGLLARRDVRLIVETHSKQLERDCKAFLEERGYFCRIVKNAWWRIMVPEMRVSDQNRWLWAEPA